MSNQPTHRGWYAFDFDGTLAVYHGWKGPGELGAPIALMVDLVKRLLASGEDVRIFTARAWSDGTPERDADRQTAIINISEWCRQNFGRVLPVTCTKDLSMIRLWDDRCVQVEANTGREIVDAGVPCPVCDEEAVALAIARMPDGAVIRKALVCVKCRTEFEPVVTTQGGPHLPV